MNINLKQGLAILIGVLSVLMASTAQLNDLFGPAMAKLIVSGTGLLNGILSSVLAVITAQGATVKEVLSMPGIEKVEVNSKANATLATIAVDPALDKISPAPGQVAAVNALANLTP